MHSLSSSVTHVPSASAPHNPAPPTPAAFKAATYALPPPPPTSTPSALELLAAASNSVANDPPTPPPREASIMDTPIRTEGPTHLHYFPSSPMDRSETKSYEPSTPNTVAAAEALGALSLGSLDSTPSRGGISGDGFDLRRLARVRKAIRDVRALFSNP